MIRTGILIALGAAAVVVAFGELQPRSEGLPDFRTHRVILFNRAIFFVYRTGPLSAERPTTWRFGGVGQASLLYTQSDRKQCHFVYARCWGLALVFAVYPTLAFIRGPLRRYRRRRRGLCPACAYDLRGNESGVCPECATEIKLRRDSSTP